MNKKGNKVECLILNTTSVNSNIFALKIIANQWSLRLNRLRDFNIAVKILKKSIKYN